MSTPVVGIIMGSDSDMNIMREACTTLDSFGIGYEVIIASAHRTPERATRRRPLPYEENLAFMPHLY